MVLQIAIFNVKLWYFSPRKNLPIWNPNDWYWRKDQMYGLQIILELHFFLLIFMISRAYKFEILMKQLHLYNIHKKTPRIADCKLLSLRIRWWGQSHEIRNGQKSYAQYLLQVNFLEFSQTFFPNISLTTFGKHHNAKQLPSQQNFQSAPHHHYRSVRVAEWLALPTFDHGIASSNPIGGEILPEPKRCFVIQSTSCSPFHHPNMTEILLKGMYNP